MRDFDSMDDNGEKYITTNALGKYIVSKENSVK